MQHSEQQSFATHHCNNDSRAENMSWTFDKMEEWYSCDWNMVLSRHKALQRQTRQNGDTLCVVYRARIKWYVKYGPSWIFVMRRRHHLKRMHLFWTIQIWLCDDTLSMAATDFFFNFSWIETIMVYMVWIATKIFYFMEIKKKSSTCSMFMLLKIGSHQINWAAQLISS